MLIYQVECSTGLTKNILSKLRRWIYLTVSLITLTLFSFRAYLNSDNSDRSPLILVGQSGAGKSSIIARSARDACDTMEEKAEKGKVFVHFVGAAPGSTDLVSFLKRLIAELSPENMENITDLQGYVQLASRLLSTEGSVPVLLFIDAINQV